MKRYFMKQTHTGDKARFLIYYENGEIAYRVTGEQQISGERLQIEREGGDAAAFIKHKNAIFVNRYSIEIGDKNVKVWQSLATGIPVVQISKLGWHIRGDLISRSFDILNVDNSVEMIHSTRWGGWGSGYEMDIENEENELLCLAIGVCIDHSLLGTEQNPITAN